MKKNNKRLILLLIGLFMLTGCTKTLKDDEKKVVTNEKTGQSITENIICQPTDKELLKIYEEKEIKGEFVLIVDGFKGEKQAKNNYDELSEREYVEVLINTGLSKKDAIKTVCKDRKLKKDVVYKQVLDL